MIQALLLRWGLGAIAAYVVPGLVALALGGGGLALWWLELTDWKTIMLLVVALGLVLQYAQTESRAGRIVLVALLGGALYLKGTFDQQVRSQGELDAQARAHEAQLVRIQAAFKKASDDELQRQQKVIEVMEQRAALEQKDWEQERREARARIKQLEKEAADDADANRTAFGVDAVKRLNSLRHDPGRKRARPKGGGRGSKARKVSLLDDASVSATYQDAGRAPAAVPGRVQVAARSEAIRRLSQKARGLREARDRARQEAHR